MRKKDKNLKIQKAMDIVGGAKMLSKLTGKSLSAIYSYLNNTRNAPAEVCVAIERVTGGKISRKSLYSGDWRDAWPELMKKSSEEF